MALYYTLPVYKASYKLVMMLFESSSNFAREYKYTTGQELKNQGFELIKNIYRANKAMNKTRDIGHARENIEMIRLSSRLMQEFNQLSLKKFIEINLAIEEVSKQLCSWERFSRTKPDNKDKALPESPVARARASEQSKSHSPLGFKAEEFCPALKDNSAGQVAPADQKVSATKSEVIIPLAGYRNRADGSLSSRGSNGNYWSSSSNGINAYNLNFNSTSVNPANNNNRANGLTVRCVKDLQKNVN
jgi:hypothetical protein